MEVAVTLAAGIGVVVILVAVVRRRRISEAESIDDYRQTLDVLGHLGGGERSGVRLVPPPEPGAARTPGSAGRVGVPGTASFDDRAGQSSAAAGGAREPGAAGGAGRAGGAREPGGVGRAGGEVLASFDDLGKDASRQPLASSGSASVHPDRSLNAMQRPARRLGGLVAALAVLVAAGAGAAYVVVRSHHVAHPPRRSAGTHAHVRTPPTTTLPAKYTAVASTSSSATYQPLSTTYSLTIGATTSDCWMSVTSATGTMVLAQTFAPGASASLSLTGHSTIVIGAPGAAKVSITGVPVVLPGGAGGPLTVTLVPR